MHYNLKKYFWLLTFAIFSKVNSQTYINAYQNLVENNDPKHIVKSVDSLINLCNQEQKHTEKIQIAHAYSLVLNNNYAYDLAIKYGQIDVSGYENELKLSNTKYSNALFNLGLFYMENGIVSLAISNFKKVIEENNYPKKVGQAYCQMGHCFYTVGDLYKSIDFYKKGLAILEKENLPLYTYNALTLSWIYEQINTPESLKSKIVLLKYIEELHYTAPLNFTQLINLNNDIASYYDNDASFNFKKSRNYYQKNIDLSLNNNNLEHLGTIYTSLGSLYTYAAADSALYYFKKGLKYSKEKNVIARNHNLTATYYLLNKESRKALESTNNSLKASLNVSKLDFGDINLLEQSIDKDVTIWALIQKAEALIQEYYNSNTSINLIKDALFHLQKADALITEINKIEFEEDSQLHWQEEAVKIYSNAIICSHLLKKPELAFNYIEKSKTLLLNQAISRNVSQYQLPESLNFKNFEYKERILDIKYTLETAKTNVNKKILQDSLFAIKYAFDLFKDSLKINYPKYIEIEAQIKPLSTKTIQEKLDDNSMVLAYSWPDDDVITNKIGLVAITKNAAHSFLINHTKNLDTLISSYKTSISKPLNSKKDLEAYREVAYKLYENLIPKNLNSKLNKKDLIIIPDGNLQYVPFEALITNESSSDFLIESSMISYAYSMTSLLNNNAIKRNTTENFTGFSPITFKNQSLTSLDYTSSEIETIIDITSGTKFEHDNANKANFLTNSNNSKIIHLATHANAAGNPWIAFNDEKLQLHELYTYKNKADLVVLSACNTSLGNDAKGEGVLSLARGFFYSGAKSVVSTLWNVNDKSSSVLMTNFYKNLKSENSKVTALHKAKLEYLSTHELSEKSPYYWASFILIGDTEKVTFSNNHHPTLLIIFSFTLLLLIYLTFKKLKK